MFFITLLWIGIGLSMDAFSLALCYGVLNLNPAKRRLLALIVGCFHFVMPLLGMVLGNIIKQYIFFDMRYVVFIIFILLGSEMIINALKNEINIILLNTIGLFIFAFTVSIDSFSAGIGVKFISDNYILGSIIFSITSFLFTYMGLVLGGMIGNKYKNVSKIIGGIILIVFALQILLR